MEIVESSFVNSDQVKVSFEVPCADWCLIQQSENWQRIQNFLEVSESRGSQMSLTDKVRLLEKGDSKGSAKLESRQALFDYMNFIRRWKSE